MKTFAIAILAVVLGLISEPVFAQDSDPCNHHGTGQCRVVTASVRGYACQPLAVRDESGPIGYASADGEATREAQIACAAEASHALYGEVYRGVFAADGGDAFTIRPAEVTVLGVDRVR